MRGKKDVESGFMGSYQFSATTIEIYEFCPDPLYLIAHEFGHACTQASEADPWDEDDTHAEQAAERYTAKWGYGRGRGGRRQEALKQRQQDEFSRYVDKAEEEVFRAECIRRGTSASELIQKFMRKLLKKWGVKWTVI